MAESEIDRIDPEPVIVKLSTGYEVGIQRLKTRQFFRLLKVLTRGVGPAMVQSGLDFGQDREAFGKNLLAMTLMAIPEAEQQFIEFLQSMCTPPGLHEMQRRRPAVQAAGRGQPGGDHRDGRGAEQPGARGPDGPG